MNNDCLTCKNTSGAMLVCNPPEGDHIVRIDNFERCPFPKLRKPMEVKPCPFCSGAPHFENGRWAVYHHDYCFIVKRYGDGKMMHEIGDPESWNDRA